jgi:peptide/nickel transport system substrate-binding protein
MKIGRREFLRVTAVASAGAFLAACGATPTATPVPPTATKPPAPANTPVPAAPTATQAPAAATAAPAAPTATKAPAAPTAAPAATAFKEAPMLADLVKAGKLPSVDQRLPKSPMVVKPLEAVGKYGGNWRMIMKSTADTALFVRSIAYEGFLRWDPNWTTVLSNVAEAVEANKDATQFTIKLRDGMKWSDGKPFTSDDVKQWYEDILLNKEIVPAIPTWLVVGGKAATFEFPDKLTVKVSFSAPNGLFISRLATPDGLHLTANPAHWVKQFLPKYDQANVDKLVKDGQYKSWVDMFAGRVGANDQNPRWSNPTRPHLLGWVNSTPYPSKDQVNFERNAYYWKVDTAGNQLPYIDKVTISINDSVDAMLPKALNGEIDIQARHFNTNANKAVLFDSQAKGGYRFFTWVDGSPNRLPIMLNLSIEDKVKSQVFNNKDFRIGLSYAIDRKKLIDTVLVGDGTPAQVIPKKDSELYDDAAAKQYTEYSVAKANAALDKAFPNKDAQGRRLGPDGKPISFTMQIVDTQSWQIDMMNLIAPMWKAVGVEVQPKPMERSLFYANKDANTHDAAAGWDAGPFTFGAILDPRNWFPFSSESYFGVGWYTWYANKGAKGVEPPAKVKEQFALYEQIVGSADIKQQIALMKKILAIFSDEFYVIGVCWAGDGYGIVKNNMKNTPVSCPNDYTYPSWAPTNPEQYYFS